MAVVLRQTNLPGSGTAGAWDALVLDVERPVRAVLRVETTGRGHLLLRQGDTVALLAKVDDDRAGVEYAGTGQFDSPIPPIRTARATTVAGQGSGSAWQARWAHHFAAALAETTVGPLHTGRWVISREVTRLQSTPWARDVTQRWTHLLLPDHRGSIDWFTSNGGWQILPLRRLANPDDGRVKSYRKQARDGILPPVLLWWISGLDCYLLLDGHDRLVAATAEDQEPPLLALSTVDRQQADHDTRAAVNRYTTTVDAVQREVDAGTPGSAQALAAVNRQLARNLRAIGSHGTTRAWPLAGGTAAWNETARAHAPAWLAEVAGTDDA